MPRITLSLDEFKAAITSGLADKGWFAKVRTEGEEIRWSLRIVEGEFQCSIYSQKPESEAKPSILDKVKNKVREFNFEGE